MFESVMVSLNNFPISANPLHYNYRSYLEALMTYNSDVKLSQLYGTQGFADDSPRFFGPVKDNEGFKQRMNRFREDCDETKAYKAGGTIYSN